VAQEPTQDYNPIEPPTDPLPPLRPEQIPATAYDVLNAMHEATVENFRQALAPALNFPSMWRLAKAVVYEQGPITIYRYTEQE
jgi:hypothetical protein